VLRKKRYGGEATAPLGIKNGEKKKNFYSVRKPLKDELNEELLSKRGAREKTTEPKSELDR